MLYELEFAAGLVDIVRAELYQLNGKMIETGTGRGGELAFEYQGPASDLLQLRTVIAVYHLLHFNIPRPKALLGHQHFHRLLDAINNILELSGSQQYQSLHISAAGSQSSIMLRFKQELSRYLRLKIDENEGDLYLRLRRTPEAKQGWDVLIRLTPRPLSTRKWRVCNFPGALNASVARAMIYMTKPDSQDIFLNIACGSGTILIERADHMPAKLLTGCDIDPQALNCAKYNIEASGLEGTALIHSDGSILPLPDASVDKICADLPFGQLVGSHTDNSQLYPAILQESARVAKSGASFVIITHEVRLMERLLQSNTEWRINQQQMLTLTGLHPRIFVLERT